MLVNDLQAGNTVEGPTGEFAVGPTLMTNDGPAIILKDVESGLGAIVLVGDIAAHEGWTLKTRNAPSGAAQVTETAESDALRSEVKRLTKLTDALVQGQQNEAQKQATPPADPADETPATLDVTPVTDRPQTPAGGLAAAPTPTPEV